MTKLQDEIMLLHMEFIFFGSLHRNVKLITKCYFLKLYYIQEKNINRNELEYTSNNIPLS